MIGVVGLAWLSLAGRRPDNLGVRDGRLAPCPGAPNCVCSQADDAHHVAPLAWRADVDPSARLQEILADWPRTTIVTADDDYLHVECRSALFGFVDDLEILIDRAAQAIHVRSASRVGHSDLGVNRRRVERLRQAWEAMRQADPTQPAP